MSDIFEIDFNYFYDYCKNGDLDAVKRLYRPGISIDLAIEKSCLNNRLECAKWLYTKEMIHDNKERLFKLCCYFGCHTSIVQWIYDISTISEKTLIDSFHEASRSCRCDIIKWLYPKLSELKTTMELSYVVSYSFNVACSYGHTELAETLLNLINFSRSLINFGDAFVAACRDDKTTTAEWLLTFDFDIKKYANQALENACSKGDIEQFKWLKVITSQIPLDIEFCFYMACLHSQIEMAKFLLETNKEIDIHTQDDFIFKRCCRLTCSDSVEYLLSLDDFKLFSDSE